MSDVVEVEGLSAVIGEILDEYSEEVKEKTAEASKKAAAPSRSRVAASTMGDGASSTTF